MLNVMSLFDEGPGNFVLSNVLHGIHYNNSGRHYKSFLLKPCRSTTTEVPVPVDALAFYELLVDVVALISLYCVVTLALVRHTLGWGCEAAARKVGRVVGQDMLELGPGSMVFTSTHEELIGKVVPEVVEPSVVVSGLACPDSARVILVCNLVTVFSPRTVCNTVCGGKQLSVLDHHFGAVNIGMVNGCLLRTFVKVENIHFFAWERIVRPSGPATYYNGIPGNFNEIFRKVRRGEARKVLERFQGSPRSEAIQQRLLRQRISSKS